MIVGSRRAIERLFAPWRIEWINREEKNQDVSGCVFCELPARENDADNLIVARSEHSFVMLNNYPYNPGHVMVIPEYHTDEYSSIPPDALCDHAKLQARTFDALRAALSPDGFNSGMNIGDGSGGSIREHVHTHIVPRWEGDTNFMPVLGETKVIVEAVDATYDAIHKGFKSLSDTEDTGEDSAVFVSLEDES
jgi:ATP adenylyltransferase